MSAWEVDQYLRGLEEPKRSTLAVLRRTILEIVPDAEQVISYRVPAFRSGQDDRWLCGVEGSPQLPAVQRLSALRCASAPEHTLKAYGSAMADRPCPCCGYLTLDRSGLIMLDGVNFGSFENCAVCGWEDDPSARDDASVRTSNGISLIEGQENFNRFGACLEQLRFNVRPPRPDETPADSRASER